MDADRPTTNAVAVRGGKIIALGDDVVEATGVGTEVIDLQGGALLPGFGDGHVHPLLAGLGLLGVPIRDAASVAEIQSAVAEFAAARPDEEWIVGNAFDPSIAPGGLLDARWLDTVVPDRPVALRTMDHHTLWVNSEALRRVGYDASTPDPDGGEIVRRDDGTPLGTLREWGAIEPVLALPQQPTHRQQVDALVKATTRMVAAGITWVHDAMVEPDHLPVWLDAAAAGRLRLRANLAFYAEPTGWRDQLVTFETNRERITAEAGPNLTARTVKFYADGVIESGTAALLDPYTNCPTSHGMANWSPEELSDALTAVDERGFQVHIHAIGDAGIRLALDAIETMSCRNGMRDRRSTIAHLQLIDSADLPRIAELGVVAVFSPLWAQPEPLMVDLTLPRLGTERGARQYQIRSVLESGATVSFGSDWPVTDYHPMAAIATAVTRQMPDGEPAGGWLPEERVNLADALRAYTVGAAYQAFEENSWGRIATGMRADLVQLSHDPMLVEPIGLHDIGVISTWLGGIRTA